MLFMAFNWLDTNNGGNAQKRQFSTPANSTFTCKSLQHVAGIELFSNQRDATSDVAVSHVMIHATTHRAALREL